MVVWNPASRTTPPTSSSKAPISTPLPSAAPPNATVCRPTLRSATSGASTRTSPSMRFTWRHGSCARWPEDISPRALPTSAPIRPVKAPFPVTFRYDHVARLLGKDIPHQDIRKILEALEIKIVEQTPEALRLEVPAYRVDVQREADVIAERPATGVRIQPHRSKPGAAHLHRIGRQAQSGTAVQPLRRPAGCPGIP